jgi:hypothetical protein
VGKWWILNFVTSPNEVSFMLGLRTYIYFVSNCTVQVQTYDNIKTGITFAVVRICHEQVMCSAVCSGHFLPQQQWDVCVIMHMWVQLHRECCIHLHNDNTAVCCIMDMGWIWGAISHLGFLSSVLSQQGCGSRKSIKVSLNISVCIKM